MKTKELGLVESPARAPVSANGITRGLKLIGCSISNHEIPLYVNSNGTDIANNLDFITKMFRAKHGSHLVSLNEDR